MAKFCTKCGQAIVEGQEHICPAAEPVNNGSQINLNKEVTSDMGMANQDAAPKADAPTPIVTPDTNTVNAAPKADTPNPNMNSNVNPQMNPNMNGQMNGQYQNPNMNGQMNGQYQNPNMNGQYQNPQMNPNMNGQYQNQQMAQQMAAIQNVASNIFVEFIDILTKPISKGYKFAEKGNVLFSVIFFVLQGLLSGLFGAECLGKCSTYISRLFSLLSSFFGGSSEKIDLPYAKAFIITVIISVAFSFLLSACVFAVNSILKIKVSFTQSMALVAVRSVFVAPAIVVAAILFQLNVGFGIIVFMLTAVVGLVMVTVLEAELVPKDKKDMYSIVMSLALVIFIAVTLFVMSKSAVVYVPDAADVLDGASGFLSGLLQDLY